jgi:hypothetical protein
MKKLSLLLISLVLTTLTACAVGAMITTPSDTTPTPVTDFSQKVATIVSVFLTQTAAPAAVTPIPAPSSLPVLSATNSELQSSKLGIHFSYPGSWHLQDLTAGQTPTVVLSSFDPAQPPHKLERNEHTISMQLRLLQAGSVPDDFDGWLDAARKNASETHLSIYEEERFLIADEPAVRFSLVSGSGGIIHQVLTVLNGQHYEITIEGNLDLGNSVLNSIQVEPSSELKPADSDTPAAGICSNAEEDPVDIILGNDPSGLPIAGRCIVINPVLRINLINQSNESFNITFAGYEINLPVGGEMLLDRPVGEYLATGVHYLPMAPALWVKTTGITPAATMPGPLQDYENPAAGYKLTLPPGWDLDEFGAASPNKEVLFYPNGAEPYITYLSISLDSRTLDQITTLYAQDVPDATREDTIFNGLPAIKFTYSYGRNEYYVPYNNKIFLIITDRPENGNVQLILMSIRFM